MTDDKVYEVKKTVTLTKHLQLIDLNGLRVNFQSDCMLSVKSDQRFQACIVTQDDLDEGRLNFEDSEHGKYARRVVYQKNTPLNHFAAIRLCPSKDVEEDEEDIECSVVVRLKELPAPDDIDVKKKKVSFSDDKTREKIQQQLQALSDDPSYTAQSKEIDLGRLMKEESLPSSPTSPSTSSTSSSPSPTSPTSPRSRPWNIWIWIGILCFLLCGILWWRQSRSSKTVDAIDELKDLVPQLE